MESGLGLPGVAKGVCTCGCEVHTWVRLVHMWPGGYAHMVKRMYTHGQEGVHTWPAGLVRQVYSGYSQPVVKTFSCNVNILEAEAE